MSQLLSEDLLWSQIVARAWSDQALKHRLLSEPRDVLVEHGLDLPEGTQVRVVEGTEVTTGAPADPVRYFTFPFTPPDDLVDEELAGGGAVAQCFSGACGACGMCGRCACRCACRCF